MSGVVVTGATQPLGRRLIELLLERGHGPILAVGVEEHGGFPAGVEYVRCDLSRARRLKELVDGTVVKQGLDTIVHLAFHRNPGGRRAHKLHVDATRLLLRLSESHPTLRRFIHRSSAEIYAARVDRPDLLREDHPLDLSAGAPPWIRQRVEADVTVCARMGMSPIDVVVMRCAEVLAPDMGSQLFDYLQARVCLRPLGFDPILNLLSLEDAARAFALAVEGEGSGVFNIPGKDTLKLSLATWKSGRESLGLPGPLIGPAYRLRRKLGRSQFRYELNAWRFHFNGVLDGTLARAKLGYTPEVPLSWAAEGTGGGGLPVPPVGQ